MPDPKTNELKHAASPYLQQHADNPVHWRQWTPEALAEARRDGKPILLSVGYAACHWCHVMAHESFEDQATADVMNALFVNIKVDREERPDVDGLYMAALHALGQRGGWPLTMFLTPDAAPFWGGTYFPKTARYGQPAFVTVLKSVEHAFRTKPDQVAENTRALLSHVGAEGEGAGTDLTGAEMDGIAGQLVRHMDPVNGGMQGAPKFPNPQILEFLWRAADRGIPGCREQVLRTLDRMSQGGIYDHLGGGYARYSVDERWLVPHFEKMLYDNAQLLELLALAWLETGDPLFAARARETAGWLRREMTAADGAFCASLDADSEGQEGKFYVWQAEEIEAVLGGDDAAVFAAAYDVTPEGNFEDPHGGGAANVLNRLRRAPGDAASEARLAAMRERLLAHRAGRVRPGLDDKILADWNGLMIAALARAGTALGEPGWIDARAYAAIMDTMAYREGGHLRLAHSRRGAASVRPAFALDYAAMARAALALAEARGTAAERDYTGEAAALLDSLLAFHRDEASGLLAMAATDAGDVILRLKPTADDAIPNAHPVALDAMLRLAALTGEERWREAADDLFAALAGAVRTNTIGHVGTLNALDLRLRGTEIVVAGPDRAALRDVALATPWLARTVLDLADADALPADHPARAQVAAAGSGAAFVCRSGACSLPSHDAAALQAALATG